MGFALFDEKQVQAYLTKLGLQREQPSDGFLNRLVAAHQSQIPFETITKILDYELQHEHGGFIPPADLHLERMLTQGLGGTCWTLARSFHALLQALGFTASLAYMDPGHICVLVLVNQTQFYADVGYGAPLFRAYPANHSFRVEARHQVFEYAVQRDEIIVSRHPGPIKTLSLMPRQFHEFESLIEAANDWKTSLFLQTLTVSRYIDGHMVRLVQNQWLDYREPDFKKRILSEDEVAVALRSVFGIDPKLYEKARAIQGKYAPQS